MNNENQPLPGDGGPRRNCTNCAFSKEIQLPPPQIGKTRICLWGPPGVVLIPDGRGGATLTTMFPNVNETVLCNQHRLTAEIANAISRPRIEPAN
jgi:hypothetical protein